MKDYYDILGINQEASLAEIQHAYQKLALKFHPDNNGGDLFFVSHYEKIKEAYQVLSDDHKRFRYDKARTSSKPEEQNLVLDGPAPVVASFFASKKAGKKGDLLTISWEVLNAEVVHINLIGEVASNGTQTIRLEEENVTTKFLTIILKASNSHSSKEVVKDLKIKNLDYDEITEHQASKVVSNPVGTSKKQSTISRFSRKTNKKVNSDVEEDDDDDDDDVIVEVVPKKKKLETSRPRQKNDLGMAYVLILVMVFIVVLLLYKMHQINPMF